MEIEAFIAKWQGQKGGAERTNFQPFVRDFCDVFGLLHPPPAKGGE